MVHNFSTMANKQTNTYIDKWYNTHRHARDECLRQKTNGLRAKCE